MLNLMINGEARTFDGPLTVRSLLAALGLEPAKIAVERNREIVLRSAYDSTAIMDGDALEIVHFIGGGMDAPRNCDVFTVAGRTFSSRLLVGTGKYKDFEETARAIEASGAEIVTVAVRRVNIATPGQPMLVDYVSPQKYTFLPNTAGCYTADDAVRTLRLAREAGQA
jgi:thiazole synthase